MAIWDLSTVDIVSAAPDGSTRLLAVVTTWEPEALRLAQLAFKMLTMRAYGEATSPYRIEVVSYQDEPPPESVVGLARLVDAIVTHEQAQIVTGRPASIGFTDNGELDWATVHAANAAQFAEQHGLPGTLESLRELDDLLADAYATAAADRDEDGDIAVDGNLVILAGSYASEVMLAAFGGQWVPPDPATHLPDFRISVGSAHNLTVGALGKVRKFLRDGPADAVHPLAQVVAERL